MPFQGFKVLNSVSNISVTYISITKHFPPQSDQCEL